MSIILWLKELAFQMTLPLAVLELCDFPGTSPALGIIVIYYFGLFSSSHVVRCSFHLFPFGN
jgi:hypothetical protein